MAYGGKMMMGSGKITSSIGTSKMTQPGNQRDPVRRKVGAVDAMHGDADIAGHRHPDAATRGRFKSQAGK